MWINISINIGLLVVIIIVVVAVFAAKAGKAKKSNDFYKTHKKRKIRLLNGSYECQACGQQGLSDSDTSCKSCGTTFEE